MMSAFDAEFFQDFARIARSLLPRPPRDRPRRLGDEMAAISGADDRAAERHDAVGRSSIEHHVIAGRKQSFEAIEESEDFPAEFFRGENDAAQDGVQARDNRRRSSERRCGASSLRNEIKSFLRIDQSTGGGPLIVKLPAAREKLRPSPKRSALPRMTMMRCRGVDRCHLPSLNNFGFASARRESGNRRRARSGPSSRHRCRCCRAARLCCAADNSGVLPPR